MDKGSLIAQLRQIADEAKHSEDKAVQATASILLFTLAALKAPSFEIILLMNTCADYGLGMIGRARAARAESVTEDEEFPETIGG